jgi:ribosomal protein L11 methylase PrmA
MKMSEANKPKASGDPKLNKKEIEKKEEDIVNIEEEKKDNNIDTNTNTNPKITCLKLINSESNPELIQEIKNNYAEFKAVHFNIEKIGEKNWVEETQKQFHAQQFGKYGCACREKKQFFTTHKRYYIYEPNGICTGLINNATLFIMVGEAGCGKAVIDYGCGSGILAWVRGIGCANCVSTDHDPQALESTLNNANIIIL